jgi:hypothetical protein
MPIVARLAPSALSYGLAQHIQEPASRPLSFAPPSYASFAEANFREVSAVLNV